MMRAIPTALLAVVMAGLAAAQTGPDLVLDTAMLAQIRFDAAPFADDACELQPIDRCVEVAGGRRLLRFPVRAINAGTDDLVLGVPPAVDPPNGGTFVYSACHMHYHFDSFALYELRLPGSPTVVARGQKRSFCVEDTVAVTSTAPKRFCCDVSCGNRQGVQVGWADLYPSTLKCQWIDVTDVAPGRYDLCVRLNTAGLLAEPPSGNEGCVPVTITAPTAPAPRVKVRAQRAGARVRVGRRLTVAWRKRAPGALLSQQVWFSADGGLTYRVLVSVAPPRKRGVVHVPVAADMVAEQAKVKVHVCTRNPANAAETDAGAFQCGAAESKPFRVVP